MKKCFTPHMEILPPFQRQLWSQLSVAYPQVILQRVEAKDYLDIASMIKAGMKLERGLASAKTLFGNTFQPSESLKAIVYFEGGDLFALSREVKNILIQASLSVKTLPEIKSIPNLISQVK